MIARLGMGEIIVIVTVAFLIFGPRKLPELGKNLGRTLNEFKSAFKDNSTTATDGINQETSDNKEE